MQRRSFETTGQDQQEKSRHQYAPRDIPAQKSEPMKLSLMSTAAISKMKPGLSASCEIILKEEKDTLFVPSLSIFEKDSIKDSLCKGQKRVHPGRSRDRNIRKFLYNYNNEDLKAMKLLH